jgi:hypothetical protein
LLIRARDVTVACRLAMAEARVRLPLGALSVVIGHLLLVIGEERITDFRPCDVVAAYRLGMADVRVRFPPGAWFELRVPRVPS